MSRRVGVVVMARVPRPGAVKTRLLPALAPVDAAALYAAMLADRCAQVAALPGVDRAIAYRERDGDGDGDDAAEDAAIVPAGFARAPQGGADLGEDLQRAAGLFLGRGQPALLLGSDSPTLPSEHLERAVALLAGGGCDVVLGPDDDGGFHCVGLARPAPELFAGVPWSTPDALAATRARAARLGLRVALLPAWWDVDTPADLERLRATLHEAYWPARTAAWLRAERLRGLGAGTPAPEPAAAPWTRLSSRTVYATPHFAVREDVVGLPDGRRTLYGLVAAGACVGVLPIDDDDQVLLVRQYRHVAGRFTLEIPTGGVHAGEPVADAALRELAEEAGVRAGRLEPLGAFQSSKSLLDETAHLFVGRDLTPARPATADDSEFLAVERRPFSQVRAEVEAGGITDAMTIVAVLREALRRGG